MNAESTQFDEGEGLATISPRRRRLRGILMLAAPVIVLIGALYFYLTGGRYESTENASLQTGMVAISPSVSGKVISIEVRENQRVTKGQVLFRINPASYETAVAEAEAELADARTDIGSTQADYQEALSEVRAAEARYSYARNEAARQRSLHEEGISSKAQYDSAQTEARTARDAIAAARAKAESLRASLSGNVQGPVDMQPDVRRAASRLASARIDLKDTAVRAPQDGIVTRVNQLQVGNYVQPGRPVFMLTGLKFWVQANFKENQLRYMRVGQPATIEIDAYPDHELKGHVESFSPGTGNSFSILPAENATGNWVKVVQRLPVQIAIDEAPGDIPLSAGLSVEVEVDTGHKRNLFGPDTPPSSAKTAKASAAAQP
ncbi:MAG: HlyD family secretion protein [Novosphingobium sp.]|nr:HlyD family secretion protein [Novosphingobium sp.]MCP5402410.1 HlyD family secretion protein [Novosphingobium sp.]